MSAIGSDLASRRWTYTTVAITLIILVFLFKLDPSTIACLDTGCAVTLIDKVWLLRQHPQQKIKEISIFLKVRGIGSLKHESA